MLVTVKCFGIAKDIVGSDDVQLSLTQGNSVKLLKETLISDYPAFAKYKSFMVAVNQSYALDDLSLTDGDEIAIIPPVAGG